MGYGWALRGIPHGPTVALSPSASCVEGRWQGRCFPLSGARGLSRCEVWALATTSPLLTRTSHPPSCFLVACGKGVDPPVYLNLTRGGVRGKGEPRLNTGGWGLLPGHADEMLLGMMSQTQYSLSAASAHREEKPLKLTSGTVVTGAA